MSNIKLEVGKKYRTNAGYVVKITEKGESTYGWHGIVVEGSSTSNRKLVGDHSGYYAENGVWVTREDEPDYECHIVEEAEDEEKAAIKLRVGGTYRLRNGKTVKCERLYNNYGKPGDSYSMCRYIVNGCCYQEDGTFANSTGGHVVDVVEEIADDSFGTFADAKDSLAQGEPDTKSGAATTRWLDEEDEKAAYADAWPSAEMRRALVKDQEKLDAFITPDLPAGDTKGSILDEAKNAVTKRRENYGSPKPNFERIAALWDAYFMAVVEKRSTENGFEHSGSLKDDYNGVAILASIYFTTADVAAFMRLVKEARLIETPDHRDSLVDIAGYASCQDDCNTDYEEAK